MIESVIIAAQDPGCTHLQVAFDPFRPVSCLDGIGERAFVPRLAGNVHENGGQAHGPRGEVQGWDRGHVDTVAV